jgi:tetratricopeptide (TPR) repeat protein
VIAGVVIGLSLRNDGAGSRDTKRAGNGTKAERTTPRAHKPAATKTAAQPAATAPAAPAANANGNANAAADSTPSDPAAANDQGFRLINAGDYASAVAPLRTAVQGFRDAGRTDEITYYYALYNLGVALNRSGNPADAIPYLQERLRSPNQQGTVKQELKSAQNKLAGGGKPGTGN